MSARLDAPESNDQDSEDFRPDWRSMWGVLVVQAHNVFNDKISQFMLISLAVTLGTGMMTDGDVPLTGAAKTTVEESASYQRLMVYELIISFLVALPFVIFAPFAGWISDRYSKRNVLLWCLYIQAAVLIWITLCLRGEYLWWATLGFFFLAFQSTLLSPAKMGICKELVGSRKLAVATGWMQMLVVISIIIGTVIGGIWFANMKQTKSEWDAAATIIFWLLIFSFAQIGIMQFVRKTPVQSRDPFKLSMAFEHFRHLEDLFSHRELRLAGIAVSYFWFAGGAIALILIDVGKEWQFLGRGDAGAIFAKLNGVVGVGIVLGSLIVAVISRRGVELGLVPVGALGLSIACVVTALNTNPSIYYTSVCALGVFGGIFLVPLNAFIQDTAPPEKRGRITSAVNVLNSIGGMLAIGFVYLLRKTGLDSPWHFGVLSILTVIAGIYVMRLLPQHFMRIVVLALVKMIYRITPLNADRIPKEGGVLMICNHVSYIDAFMISAASPRPVRFVIEGQFLKFRAFAWFLRMFNVIPISSTRAKDAIRTTANAVIEGSVVCIFPEGMLTRTGMLNPLKKGFELITRQAEAPILPVYMDALWGSIFSFERFRYFYKLPKRLRYPVTVNFGHLIPQDEIEGSHVREVIQDLAAEAFPARREFEMSLGEAVIGGLTRRKRDRVLIEIGKHRRELSRGVVLGTAATLAHRLTHRLPEEQRRIGILLPAGALTGLINVALVLAKRVPVNLPLHLLGDPERRKQLLAEHGIETVISSHVLFRDKQLPDGFLDMASEISQVDAFAKLKNRILAGIAPRSIMVRRCNVRHQNLDEEAVAYISDDHEFVGLSHRNALASVLQIDSSFVFLPGEQIYLETPFNSAAAMFLGLWFPLIRDGRAVFRGLGSLTTPSLSILLEAQPQLVLLDPRLSQGMITDQEHEISESIRVIFAPFPNALTSEQIVRLEASGAQFCEIFAPNDLGTIVSLNTMDPDTTVPSHLPQTGNRKGTVGRLMPGVTARIAEVNGSRPPKMKSLWEEGAVLVKGASLHHDRKTDEGNKWIVTGYRGSFDRDGFLTLTGPTDPSGS